MEKMKNLLDKELAEVPGGNWQEDREQMQRGICYICGERNSFEEIMACKGKGHSVALM